MSNEQKVTCNEQKITNSEQKVQPRVEDTHREKVSSNKTRALKKINSLAEVLKLKKTWDRPILYSPFYLS